MSNKTHPPICQEKVSHLQQQLEQLYHALRKNRMSPRHTIPLKLAHQQKALLAAWWPTPNMRKILITDSSPAKSQILCKDISSWNTKLGKKEYWHLISGQLSSQEQAGEAITSLSQTLSALLSENKNHHFVLPTSLLSLPLPDPTQYKRQRLALTVNEEYPLQKLAKHLINLGWLRHHRSIEPGFFTIQGENLSLSHPYSSQRYTITFRHNTIEQIIKHGQPRKASLPFDPDLRVEGQGKPNTTINNLLLPPLGFPAATTSWHEFFKKRSLVIRPSYLKQIAASHTIIDDALHPLLPFPWSEDDLNFPPSPAQAKSPSPISYQRSLELIQELTPGKPAVHCDHGIGIFEGLAMRTIGNITQEYLILRYAEGDTLSVPTSYAHKVSAYIGVETPPITRLSDATWKTTKRQASQNAVHLARELLQIARGRSLAERPRYVIDHSASNVLDDKLPYTLTLDQIKAWQDIQHDLQQSSPMDRLIVGDVGFGKTEIAIRTASLAVANHRQVALLAPTTLLVQQHYDTFSSRLSHLAGKIAPFSRFSTPAEQAQIHQGISDGTISIVIGTHGLLSHHIKWHNLGLAIIDEEQRFGVNHKEHFKKLRSDVDILSLSATPIPRTLSLALSGLKSLSIIATPPEGRQDVTVTVSKDNNKIITQALQLELARQGQAYVIAPRVRQLSALQERLRALLPQARIAITHGQMNDHHLATTMHQFDTGAIDILVSSTIIASGLDLPTTNTIIVIDATHLGLSDLYQLRGRIGRRRRQGHAYFLYNSGKLSPLQRQRLTALTEASRLGSGWKLARRDLELRGAGNLLGAQQSGAIQSVGLALYLDLVKEATHSQQGQLASPAKPGWPTSKSDIDIHLPPSAHIPTDYIANLPERTRWYQRLTRADTSQQLTIYAQQLQQTFGPLPPETRNLLLLLQLRLAAAHLNITKINSVTISPPGKAPFQRLTIKGNNLPQILPSLTKQGPWQIRGSDITRQADNISPRLVQQILLELKRARSNTNHKHRQRALPFPAARNS